MAIVKISDLPLVDSPVEGTDLFVVVQDNVTKKAYASDIQTYVGFEEVQYATAGQTVFNLTTMTYAAGANNLQVFVDGVNQYEGLAYTETDNNTVTFTQGLHQGAVVKFSTVQTQTSSVANAGAITYTPNGGANAVPSNVQAKLREFVTPEDFGAVGDGVTDDTAAVQKAVNYCMTDPECPKALLIAGKYLLTATVNINATGLSVIAARKNYFRMIGIGDGAGFYANSALTMFSSSDYTGVQSVVAMVQWENVAFVSGSTSYVVRVISGAFIQVLFNSCVFYRVGCMATSNVNTFSYWFNNCHIKAWPATFFELLYTSANDIIFDGCYFNGTAGSAFPAIRLSLVQGFKCTNNTFESMNGEPIILRGSRSCEISGNYFEGCSLIDATYYIDLNEAGTSEVAGVSISGNIFFMDGAQDADPAFYAINWDAIAAGSSNGNWCSGRLHKITNAQPGYDLSINGDTQSTTGSVAGRATIRPDRYFNNCEANVLQAIPRANPPSPAYAGQIYYDSDDNKLKCYNGTSWNDLF